MYKTQDPLKTLFLELGEVDTFHHYPYEIFDKKQEYVDLDFSKTFKDEEEAKSSLFDVICNHKNDLYVPWLLGKNKGERIEFLELREKHALVAGQTRSGKTSFLISSLLTMMHYSHPEYLKVVLLDPKNSGFVKFKPIATFASSYDDICNTVSFLKKNFDKRMERTTKKDAPIDAKSFNALAYSTRNKKLIMPHIVIVFDEFQCFMDDCVATKNENFKREFHALIAKGASLGFSIILTTQSPYREYIKGPMKNNLIERISFLLGDAGPEVLALGKREEGDVRTKNLEVGEFIYKKSREGRTIYKSFFLKQEPLKTAVENLKRGGFNFRF